MSWDIERYALFLGPRTRPAAELGQRLPANGVRTVIDVGCGPGNSTEVLLARFPGAAIVGVDSDPNMIAEARRRLPAHVGLELASVEALGPDRRFDVVFSNATLQWVEGHERVMPRLLSMVAPGGMLAVQMPRNFDAASHRLLRDTARQGPWAARLEGLLREAPVHSPDRYYDWLAPLAAVDVWETEYWHVLSGPDPVLAWVSGTALVPVRAALDPAEYAEFVAVYGQRLREAYPAREDGTTLFPFRRLFFTASPR